MAFTSRQRKKGLEFSSATPARVGPGAYLESLRAGAEHAYAPFTSTSIRPVGEALIPPEKKYAPGPGYYDSEVEGRLKAAFRNSVASELGVGFATTEERFLTRDARVPGPGNYDNRPKWVENKHRYKAQKTNRRVDFVRGNSAPSIPVFHQSFGYEEGNDGALVRQAPPDDRYKGRDGDTVGPGRYESDHAKDRVTRQIGCAGVFGRSKSNRPPLNPKNANPGPGDYDPKKAPTIAEEAAGPGEETDVTDDLLRSLKSTTDLEEVHGGKGVSTSSFAYRGRLQHQKKVADKDNTPGPGAYSHGYTQAIRDAPVPGSFQCFGSTARRPYEVDQTRLLGAPTNILAPGPGAYPLKGSVTVKQMAAATEAGFASTSSRFGADATLPPGPGAYGNDVETSLATQVGKKLVSRNGKFGSSSTRFVQKAGQTAPGKPRGVPGPGSYDPKALTKPGAKKQMSTMQSKTQRFRAKAAPTAPQYSEFDDDDEVRGDPANLGPGCYQMPDAWRGTKITGPKYAAPGFGSSGERYEDHRIMSKKSKYVPGPGNYELDKNINEALKPLTVPQTGFISKDVRFGRSVKYTPGPGHYNPGTHGTFVKKSFNVTVDGVELV